MIHESWKFHHDTSYALRDRFDDICDKVPTEAISARDPAGWTKKRNGPAKASRAN